MDNEMENNVVNTVVDEAANAVVERTGMSTGGKIAVGFGVAGLVAGLVVGGIAVAKKIMKTRAEKQALADEQLAKLAATGASNVVPMAVAKEEKKPTK